MDAAMRQAEQDENLAPEQQGRLIAGVLLMQAGLVGLEAHAAQPGEVLLGRLIDLGATLEMNGEPLFLNHLRAVSGADRSAWLEGVPLLPPAYPHAAAHVLDQALETGRPLEEAARVRLDWAGYRRPPLLLDPLEPSPADLTPPPTHEPARLARDRALRQLGDSPHEGERNAALLLLHVNSRDQLENVPLIRVLDTAQVLLLSLQRAGGPAVQALLDLPDTRQFRRDRWGSPQIHTTRAWRLLRLLQFDRERTPTPEEAQWLDFLWGAMDIVDRELAVGITPDDSDRGRVWLTLMGIHAVMGTHRAPGMSLPPLVEVAAQLCRMDPLWEWERTQDRGIGPGGLRDALELLLHSLRLLSAVGIPSREAPAWTPRVHRLVGQAAGHFLATARRASIRLPYENVLQAFFAPFGPLRSVPLTYREVNTLQDGLDAALPLIRSTLEALAQREAEAPAPDEDPLHAGPPQPEAVPPGPRAADPQVPDHVREARERLAGRRVVLLGGGPSASHREALVRALDLRELDWIDSDEYAHGSHAWTHVTEDTALVILIIRRMGHAHNGLRDVARARGVPVVMHPGGLSPSSVAWQIMRQASHQLDARGQTGAGIAMPAPA